MKNRVFWLLFAVVLIGLFFLLPPPFVNTLEQMFTG
jgi:hypothetical protein